MTLVSIAAGQTLLVTESPHDARRVAAFDQVLAGWNSPDDDLLLAGV